MAAFPKKCASRLWPVNGTEWHQFFGLIVREEKVNTLRFLFLRSWAYWARVFHRAIFRGSGVFHVDVTTNLESVALSPVATANWCNWRFHPPSSFFTDQMHENWILAFRPHGECKARIYIFFEPSPISGSRFIACLSTVFRRLELDWKFHGA